MSKKKEFDQLKQQLADLQKDYDDLMLTSVDHESYYETINDLNQQLAEKDKEIEKVETYYKSREKDIVNDANEIIKKLEKQLKDQCHQICEKIRQSAIFSGLIRDDDEIGVYTIEKDVLDQIEKGE